MLFDVSGGASDIVRTGMEPVPVLFRRELEEVLDQVESELRVPEDFHEKLAWKGSRDVYVRLCGGFLGVAAKLQRVPGLAVSPLLEPNLAYVLEHFTDAASGERLIAFPAVGVLKQAIRALLEALERGEPVESGCAGRDAVEVVTTEQSLETFDGDEGLNGTAVNGAYLDGTSGMELLPSCVGSESGDLYASWTTSLLDELMTEFAPVTPSRKLLIEGVVHAHIDAAIHTATWRRLAHDDLAVGRARLVERYGRLADQCRKRVSMNLDALRRPHAGPVKVSIGSANLNFGQQTTAPSMRGEPPLE